VTPPEVRGSRAAVTTHPTTLLLRRDRTIVGLLVALAFVLRVPNLGRAYWIDEGISVGIASHPVRQIPGLLRQDGSPPLFYVLLHFWIRVFGTSPVGTHLLPLFVSLVAVPLGYWAGRALYDRRTGLATAALLATSPFLGWYATETRMYPIVIVLALVGLVLTVRAVRERAWRDVAGAVAAFAALLYTHNWGVYLFAATAIVLGVVAWARRDRQLALGVAGAGAAVIVLWLPWIPTLIDQVRNTAAPWAISPNIGYFFADQSTALGGTLGLVIAPLLLGGALLINTRRPAGEDDLPRLLGAIAILTSLFGWLAAQVEPSWTVRYLAVIVAPFLLAAAGALAWNRVGRAVIMATCVLLVGWSAIGSLLPNPNSAYAKSNVAAVAHAASAALAPGDVVVVTQTEQVAVLAHYLPKGLIYVTPTGPVTDPYVVDWRNIVSRLHRAQPCAAVNPIISTLPIGAHVLEINPVRKLGAKNSAWYRAVNGQIAAVDRLLALDPSLRAVSSYAEAEKPRPYAPVVGELFERIPGASPCR
jgi:4-amino-4-deoxy-L-arabinose transferase-like glycosyltransferase